MSDRGEYRPIFTVLVHGADYQQLTPHEKLVLIHCKLNLGASGIGVLYAAVLAEQTGLSDENVRLALSMLEHRNWVRVERNVVWVIDGLKYEPSLMQTNGPHRKWLARHLSGLPNLSIVNAFRARYADWLDTPHTGPLEAPSEAPPIPPRSTTTTTTTTTNTTKPSRAKARVSEPKYPFFPDAWCKRLYTAWQKLGTPSYPVFRKTLARLFPESPQFTVEQVERAIGVCIQDALDTGRGEFVTVSNFVDRIAYWVDKSTPIAQKDPARAYVLGIVS